MFMTKKDENSKNEKVIMRNRIKVNLNTCEIEVESYDSNLNETFKCADTIARNLGKGDGLNGITVEERVRKVGIS